MVILPITQRYSFVQMYKFFFCIQTNFNVLKSQILGVTDNTVYRLNIFKLPAVNNFIVYRPNILVRGEANSPPSAPPP